MGPWEPGFLLSQLTEPSERTHTRVRVPATCAHDLVALNPQILIGQWDREGKESKRSPSKQS